jgi:hypothetical protein
MVTGACGRPSVKPCSGTPARTGQAQLFAGLGDGTLLQSDDGGKSWSELGERIGAITALAVK